ncbi:MAG: TonB-dependent receptor [Colwellia sp.]|nr:TonB-dependent receptor [Colwellia sp.]
MSKGRHQRYSQGYTQKSNTQVNHKKNKVHLAIISSLLFTPLFANAAEDAEINKTDLEVIHVTSQKRVQNILKVPITVSTVSADTLEESSAISLGDVDKFIPGFDFNDTSMTQGGISMRGISSPNISVGGDPSSATFYDDVYMPRAAQNVLFSDMARIEVLKGPQGTLFGRNAAMGVVSMVPNSPTAEFEGFIKATLGTDSLQRYEGMVNVSVTDNVYLRGNFLTNEQDGIVNNVTNSPWNEGTKVWDLGERAHSAARVALLWDISDVTNLQLSYDWDDLEQAPPMAIGISDYAYDNGNSYMGSTAENDVKNGVEARDMYGVTAKLNHEFSDQWSMKYVLSYRDWQTINRQDEDGTSDVSRYFDTSNNEDSDILYTELQINYVSNIINAVAGFSYSKEKVNQTTELNLTTDTYARLVTGDLNQQISDLSGGQIPAMDHMWNSSEWSDTLNMLGLGDAIMAAMGMAGAPLTADVVDATGNTTYDIVSTQLPGLANPGVPPGYLPAYLPNVFGPGYAGMAWQETVNNTGDFTNWGIFVDVDYAITDKWNVIAGLRYSQDSKDFTWHTPANSFATVPVNSVVAMQGGAQIPIDNALFDMVNYQASDSWDKVTGRLVTSYQVTDDDMFFASYSTGYKSGGYDSLGATADEKPHAFAPEDSTNYEVGYKGIWAEQVIANISAYYLTLDNLQKSVSSQRPDDEVAKPLIINVDKEITGIEFDLRWMATDSITLGVVSEVRSTDTKTPSYHNALGDLITAETQSVDASFNYTLTFDWMPDFGVGTTNFHLDYVYLENNNMSEPGLEAYKLAVPEYFLDTKNLNARISWANDNDNLKIGLWGKNLLDERHVVSFGDLTASILDTPYVRINRGIEMGVDIKYSF